MKTKRVLIGTYAMFGSPVTVYAVAGSDGEGVTGWNNRGGYITVNIGMDGDWGHTLENALHEIMEWAMLISQCGYQPWGFLKRRDCQAYTYHMNHEQFTVVTQNVADAMQYLLPDLRAAHTDWKRKRKKV